MLPRYAVHSLLSLVLLTGTLLAQWTQTGPTGGEVIAMLTHGTSSFALTPTGGVFRLGGQAWQRVGGDMLNNTLTSIAADARIYIGSADRIFVSSDAGSSWQTVGASTFRSRRIRCLAANDSMVLAGTESGLYESFDHGITWNLVGNGLPHYQVNTLYADSVQTYAGFLSPGIYFSSDRGASWLLRGSGALQTHAAAILVKNAVLYAGTAYGAVYRSTDQGEHWTSIGSVGGTITCLFDDSTGLYAGTEGGGLYRKNPATAYWSGVNQGLPNTHVTAMARSGAQLLLSTRHGIFASVSGDIWSDFNAGLFASQIGHIGKAGSTIITSIYGAGTFASNDYGTSWTKSITPNHVMAGGPFVKVGSVWYAGGSLQSTNDGSSWVESPVPLSSYVSDLAASDSTLFAAGQGLFRHTVGSSGWDSLPVGSSVVTAVLVLDSIVLAGTKDLVPLGLRRSTDHGANWITCNTGLGDIFIASLAATSNTVYAGTWYGGAYRSENRGLSWSACSPDMGGGYYVHTMAASGEVVFAAAAEAGLFVSSNRGESWQSIQPGVSTEQIHTIECFDDTVYVGTWGCGLWRRPIAELVAQVRAGSRPPDFLPLVNYPNPFNSSTTISYSISQASFVTLTLLNSLGQEIQVLVAERLDAGSHASVWDADKFASGVYFCCLTTGTSTRTRKLLLLR